MEEIIWKDIPGYEGLYKININGDILSLHSKKEKLIKSGINKGYKRVLLCKNKKHKNCLVHRLVAITFIPNIYNYPQINHKNENKLDNNVSNLEWCTAQYNAKYGTRLKRISKKLSIARKGKHISPETEFKTGHGCKKVRCIELNKIYNSIKEAGEELNITPGNITNVCKNKEKNKTAGGYKWEYC